jgi:DNA-binding SARP family transcriptional activator
MPTMGAVLDGGAPTGTSAGERAASRPAVEVDLSLLGSFVARVDGLEIPSELWSRRRHSAGLVKLLALSPGRNLHREKVTDALWPDLEVDEAAPRLHKAAHYARTILGHRNAVVLGGDVVRLFPYGDVQVDVQHFERLSRTAVTLGGIAAAKAAVAVYGGALLPHDLYEPWTEPSRLRLERLYRELLHQAEDWHQALAADPADERAHLELVQRYLERGDRPAALRQLDSLEDVMRLELGLEPSAEARALRRRVLGLSRNPDRSGGAGPAASVGVDPSRSCCAATRDDCSDQLQPI